jgi:hypothetical protein
MSIQFWLIVIVLAVLLATRTGRWVLGGLLLGILSSILFPGDRRC